MQLKMQLEPDQTQLIATGPSVVVAHFILIFGCRLPYFENNQKPV
jgi:hypothetical protein